MAEILVTRRNGDRHAILLDDEDMALVGHFKWCVQPNHRTLYAMRAVRIGGKPGVALMHRDLLPGAAQIDHKNHNGLDNRRCNLRVCTGSQNMGNMRVVEGFRSMFKGVYWVKERQAWGAAITYRGKRVSLGYFTTECAAAMAYDIAAEDMHGVFACTNF